MKETYHFLLDENGRSYYVDGGGKVQTSAQPRHVSSPDGWADLGIAFERDQKKLGLMKNYTFPLRFYFDGAQIIRHLWYGKGVEVPLDLLVTRRIIEMNNDFYRDYQSKLFKGTLSISSVEDIENGVQVKIAESGLARALKAYEGMKYEFPLSHPEAVTVTLDGIPLEENNNFICTGYKQASAGFGYYLVDAGWASAEGEAAGFAGHQVFGKRIGADYTAVTTDEDLVEDMIFQTTQVITGMRFKGSRTFHVNSTLKKYRLFLYTSEGRTIDIYQLPGQLDGGGTVDFEWDITFDSLGAERFYLVEERSVSLIPDWEYQQTRFTISFASTYAATRCRAFPPAVLGDLLMEKIAGKRGLFSSALLSAMPDAGTMITSGDGIRGIEDAKVKLSFTDFFDIYRVVAFAGMGIVDEKVVMEEVGFFFRNETPIHLGDAADDGCKILSANAYMGNAIKIGYRESALEGNQGKYAFNITHNYSTKAKEVAKEISLLAPAYADPYKIETLRIKTAGKKTTDNQTDNDLYLLGVEPVQRSFSPSRLTALGETKRLIFGFGFPDIFGGEWFEDMQPGLKITLSGTGENNQTFTVTQALPIFNLQVAETVNTEFDLNGCTVGYTTYQLRRGTYDKVEGVPDLAGPRLFNVEFMSPKRLLLRQMRWFNSIFYGLEGTNIHFESTERNPGLATTIGSEVIRENADLTITGDRMFLPFIFQLQLLTTIDLIDIMEVSPYHTFSFNWRGNTFKGFLLSGGTSVGEISSQAYVLLATPDTPITLLENA